jgi:hypothetical protein
MATSEQVRPTRPKAALTRAVSIVLVRVVAVALLGASAVLGLQAWWARFGVCFGNSELPVPGMEVGSLGACVDLQDHLYGYTLPSEPWVPIADAAQREGLSLLALGLAVALVTLTVADRWVIRLLAVAAGAAVGTMWLEVGVPTLLSGRAGEPVEHQVLVPVAPLVWLLPWVTIGLAVLAWKRGTAGLARDGRLFAVFWVVMTVAQVFPEFYITLALWASHDSSPLDGFLRCTAVGVAAVVVAVTLVPVDRRARLLPRPLRWLGRVVMRALATVADRVRAADTWQDPRAER